MKVWFGTTTLKFKDYYNYYSAIRQHVINKGHVLTDDWMGDHSDWILNNPGKPRGIRSVYEDCVKAVKSSDISIIELTMPNFSSAYQINLSIQYRIPTLVLRLHKDHKGADSFIDAIESEFLVVKDYNLNTYKDIMDEFFGFAEMEEGQARYNIVLAKKHKYYLDWAANKYGVSRSSIIKDLVETRMETDKNFGMYLKDK